MQAVDSRGDGVGLSVSYQVPVGVHGGVDDGNSNGEKSGGGGGGMNDVGRAREERVARTLQFMTPVKQVRGGGSDYDGRQHAAQVGPPMSVSSAALATPGPMIPPSPAETTMMFEIMEKQNRKIDKLRRKLASKKNRVAELAAELHSLHERVEEQPVEQVPSAVLSEERRALLLEKARHAKEVHELRIDPVLQAAYAQSTVLIQRRLDQKLELLERTELLALRLGDLLEPPEPESPAGQQQQVLALQRDNSLLRSQNEHLRARVEELEAQQDELTDLLESNKHGKTVGREESSVLRDNLRVSLDAMTAELANRERLWQEEKAMLTDSLRSSIDRLAEENSALREEVERLRGGGGGGLMDVPLDDDSEREPEVQEAEQREPEPQQTGWVGSVIGFVAPEPTKESSSGWFW